MGTSYGPLMSAAFELPVIVAGVALEIAEADRLIKHTRNVVAQETRDIERLQAMVAASRLGLKGPENKAVAGDQESCGLDLVTFIGRVQARTGALAQPSGSAPIIGWGAASWRVRVTGRLRPIRSEAAVSVFSDALLQTDYGRAWRRW